MEDGRLQAGEHHGRRRSGDFQWREVSRFSLNGTIEHAQPRAGNQISYHSRVKEIDVGRLSRAVMNPAYRLPRRKLELLYTDAATMNYNGRFARTTSQ